MREIKTPHSQLSFVSLSLSLTRIVDSTQKERESPFSKSSLRRRISLPSRFPMEGDETRGGGGSNSVSVKRKFSEIDEDSSSSSSMINRYLLSLPTCFAFAFAFGSFLFTKSYFLSFQFRVEDVRGSCTDQEHYCSSGGDRNWSVWGYQVAHKSHASFWFRQKIHHLLGPYCQSCQTGNLPLTYTPPCLLFIWLALFFFFFPYGISIAVRSELI